MGNVTNGVTDTQIMGDNDNAIPIRKDTKYQDECFNVKIMEIDQELLRYELSEGGNHWSEADKEKVSNSETETTEVAIQIPPEQLTPQGKDEEHAKVEEVGEKTKSQGTGGVALYLPQTTRP